MKKILALVFAAVMVASLPSCSDNGTTTPVNDLKELHFIVRAHQNDNADPAVRSYIVSNGDGSYTPYWNNGDQLGAFFTTTSITGSTAAVDMTLTNTASAGTTGTFEGSAVAAGDGAFYAFYPQSAFAKAYAAGDVGLNMGSAPDYIQHPTLTSPDPVCDILVSKPCDYVSDGSTVLVDDLLLKRPLSLLKINLKGAYAAGEEISWLKFSIPTGTLTGRVRIDLSTPEITGWAATMSYAWAEYTTSKPVINDANDNVVWLVVNPTTLTSGTTVTVTAETENYNIEKSFSLTGDMVFPEGSVAVLNLTILEENCTPRATENYKLYTTYGAFEDGGKYIFAFQDGSDSHYEFLKNNGASSNIIADALTVTAGVITNPGTDYVFTAEDGTESGSFNFKNSNDNYIYWPSSTTLNTDNASATDWVATFLPGSLTYKIVDATGARYISTNGAGTPAAKAYAVANFLPQVTNGASLAQYAGEISVFRLIDSKTHLSTPANLAVSDKTVSWDAVAGAASYILWVGGTEYPVATNSKTLDIAAGYYDVAVVALPSDPSTNLCSQLATLSDATLGSPVIATPVLASGGVTDNSVTVTWTDDPNATNGYLCEIYEGLTKLDAKTQDVSLGTQTVTFTGLTKNTTYTVKVNGKAVTGAKAYAASEVASINMTPVSPTVSTITAAGSYSIPDLTVMAVNGSNVILADATGAVLLYKSSHGLSVGDIRSVEGYTKVYHGVFEFYTDGSHALTISGSTSTTPDYPSPVTYDADKITSYASSPVIEYATATGLANSSERTVTVADGKVLNVYGSLASVDGKQVVVTGYAFGYNSSKVDFMLVGAPTIDESTPTLSTSPASGSTMTWTDSEYGVGNAKTVTVTLNGAATGYTVSSGTAAWTVSDNGSGTITVYPNAANESTTDDKTLDITVTHNDNGGLTSTITLKQNKQAGGGGGKTNQVLFHESFGNNTGSARAWDDSYSDKSGVSAVYSGITGYTVSNVKQGKNTTGSTQSGMNQSTQGTDAYIIIGPLAVSTAENMVLTYQWKAGSIKGTYSTSLYYATSSGGVYTEVSGTGAGATSFVERSYNLPVAAQVNTLYLKIVWNTSNTQAIIDEVNLQGDY